MNAKTFLFPEPGPWIVGVLNVTPDSFSDGGKFVTLEAAADQAFAMREAGAHAVEIGGESTAPGSKPIGAEQELERVLPVVKALSSSMCIAIDTFRSKTAQQCLEHGARIINDVSALRHDPELIAVLRDFDATVVLMHSKESGAAPHVTDSNKDYADVVLEISEFLLRQVEYALKGGIHQDRIILDPGMGRFVSHDSRYSWEILYKFDRLVELVKPFPLMIGSSRKGFLGGSLADRDRSSQLSAIWAVEKGARFIRSHHVSMAAEFLDIWRNLSGGFR